jgi:hypothetical protein
MTDQDEANTKFHYICQTYIKGSGAKAALKVDKLFEYTSAAQAEERATREFRSENCVGADAYMLTEDPASGEVSTPSFMVRLGDVPEFDDF